MSTGLFPIGNHNIKFKNKDFNALTKEIKEKLDSLKFINEDFLRQDVLHWYSDTPEILKEIENKTDWHFIEENDEYYTFKKDKYLDFDGPFELYLVFDEAKITFHNPGIRYWQWFDESEDMASYRNEWRRYLFQIVNFFGGNRVIYLADPSPFSDYLEHDEKCFEDIEIKLIKEFGEPKTKFIEIVDNDEDIFYHLVDNFDNIDWEQKHIF